MLKKKIKHFAPRADQTKCLTLYIMNYVDHEFELAPITIEYELNRNSSWVFLYCLVLCMIGWCHALSGHLRHSSGERSSSWRASEYLKKKKKLVQMITRLKSFNNNNNNDETTIDDYAVQAIDIESIRIEISTKAFQVLALVQHEYLPNVFYRWLIESHSSIGNISVLLMMLTNVKAAFELIQWNLVQIRCKEIANRLICIDATTKINQCDYKPLVNWCRLKN